MKTLSSNSIILDSLCLNIQVESESFYLKQLIPVCLVYMLLGALETAPASTNTYINDIQNDNGFGRKDFRKFIFN